MSGGPLLDEDGNAVGVVSASSMRRGRVFSIAPELLKEVRQEQGLLDPVRPLPLYEVRQGKDRLPQVVEAVTRDARVAKVYCRRS